MAESPEIPLFDSQLELNDESIEAAYKTIAEGRPGDTVRYVQDSDSGQLLLLEPLRLSDLGVRNAEQAEFVVNTAPKHFSKFTELGGHVITHTIQFAKPSRSIIKRDRDPVVAYTAKAAADEAVRLSVANLPSEKIKEAIVDPGLAYIDWWLGQTDDLSILRHLYLSDYYYLHTPSNTLFLDEVNPHMTNLGVIFATSERDGMQSIWAYRDSFRHLLD